MLQKRYQSKVRVGNWFEEEYLKRFDLDQFKAFYKHGNTLLQKIDNIANNFLKPVELSTDPFIRFGSVVQLVPSQMKLNPKCKGYRPVLSLAPDYNIIPKNQNISQGVEVTVAPNKEACARNTFIIKSPDPNSCENRVLKYGENFVLQTAGPQELVLLCSPNCANLRNIIPPYNCITSECEKLPLGILLRTDTGNFAETPTGHIFWRCYHVNKDIRFETEGEPIPANTELIVVHPVTKKKLAAENVPVLTIFGNECLVNAYNPYTPTRREPWNNIWKFYNNSKAV